VVHAMHAPEDGARVQHAVLKIAETVQCDDDDAIASGRTRALDSADPNHAGHKSSHRAVD